MPDPKPKKKRRWLRRIFISAALLATAIVIATALAITHLDRIARWSIHRVFPGVRAEMKSLRIELPSRLLVHDLELRSTATGEPLLEMQSGTASFRFSEIWRARIAELELQHPVLVISPKLGDALGVRPASDATQKRDGVFSWSIGKLAIIDGRLRIAEFGEHSPTVEMRITATLQDFGVGGEVGEIPHDLLLSEIQAVSPEGTNFLSIDRIGMRFATDALFARNHVDTISIGSGQIDVTQDLLDFFGGSGTAGDGNPPPKWTVGALDLDGLDVNVPNAPGVVGRLAFHVSAALRDIGTEDTAAAESLQQIAVSRIRVETEIPSAPPLLEADLATVVFTIPGLSERRIREIVLKNPSIAVDLSQASPMFANSAPQGPANSPATLTWLIERFVCNYGRLSISGIRDGDVSVTAKFATEAANIGTLGDAKDTPQRLTIWDVQLTRTDAETPMLTLDLARVGFTLAGLLDERRIESLDIEGGRLRVGKDLQSLLATDSEPSPAASDAAGESWTIGTLKIAGIRTRLEDDRPGLTELRFTLNTEMQEVSASGLSGQLLDEVQSVEFADITLRSPLDRSVKILSLRSVFVRFAIRELARKHLREVVILRPTIFLNRDLFVYMERSTADGPASTEPAGPTDDSQWSVGQLEVKFGQLVLGSGTNADVGLPLEFETVAQNLALDNLAALELQAVLTVPKQSYDLPDYQLEIKDVQGDLRFAYPPEKGEKNLVQKLDIAGLRWRQFDAKDAWIAATFDAHGINGQFGGTSYEGYLNGGFSFFFTPDSPWIGWVAGTGIETEAFTEVISPQNFKMTGALDFSVQVDAFRKDIDRLRGNLRVTEPGSLTIGKIDDLIARIPDTWATIKQDSTRIALETLRDFDYTEATGDFWFVQSQGILNLDLSGPNGSRNFEIVLHDGQETDNPWQQGKLRAQSSSSPR